MRQVQNRVQCLVDGSVSRKGPGHLGIEKHEVGSRAVSRHVFSSNASFMDAKSYSGRMSPADFTLFFFINPCS